MAVPTLGAASEIWLKRQIDGMTRLAPHVLAWQDHGTWLPDTAPVTRMGGLPPARRSEPLIARLWQRARTAPTGNAFGATGAGKAALVSAVRASGARALCAQFGHTGLCLLPVARALDLPIAVHFHGNDISAALGNRWYARSLTAMVRDFDAIVVVGAHQRDRLVDMGADPARVHLIPCGAPVSEFRPASESGLTFVAVSRLAPEKGLHITLSAFARLAADHPDARLRIVGDGHERARLEAQARDLRVADRVTFLGSLPPEAVRRELAAAAVFVQHSLDWNGWIEGFGVSVTEAAAMGKPVIVSAAGGLMDQVTDGQTGHVVPQGDVPAMAGAMDRLARDADLRAALGHAGRARAVARFDSAGQVAKLEAVLCNLQDVRAGAER